VAGCRCEAEVPGGAASGPAPDPAAAITDADARGEEPRVLEDVMESDPRYIIGISYPPGINRDPGLGAEIGRYADAARADLMDAVEARDPEAPDRKSTRLNSSHVKISYAVFCLKKKNK